MAFVEDYVRGSMRFGVVILSVVVAIVGLDSAHGWAGVVGVVAAVLGGVAVFVPLARRSTFGRQWATIAVIIVAQGALLVAFWQWA